MIVVCRRGTTPGVAIPEGDEWREKAPGSPVGRFSSNLVIDPGIERLSGSSTCRPSSFRMRKFAPAVVAFTLAALPASAADPYLHGDPYWLLLHEPALIQELKLSATQKQAYRALFDELDLRYFPLRNKRREEALAGVAKLNTEAKEKLHTILNADQERRIGEILLQEIGYESLLRDDVAARMRYTESQRKRIKLITEETETAVAKIQAELKEGRPPQELEKRNTEVAAEQQKKLFAVLKPDQQATLKKLLGSPFDLAKLGRATYKAPELVDSTEWINSSSPQRIADLRGKVVVVHFYAFGCINCIRNFPWYREWTERFQGRDVAIIGIHTPETASERDSSNVRRKAADEKFAFPVLIDAKSENWNAWGNAMWPSVYLIDKQGYLRYFWAGELKWQGTDGERIMRDRIEELLAEKSAE